VRTSPEEAAPRRQPSRAYPGEPALPIIEANFIARWTYYIGTEKDLESRAAA
jgi:hypothetical protein